MSTPTTYALTHEQKLFLSGNSDPIVSATLDHVTIDHLCLECEPRHDAVSNKPTANGRIRDTYKTLLFDRRYIQRLAQDSNLSSHPEITYLLEHHSVPADVIIWAEMTVLTFDLRAHGRPTHHNATYLSYQNTAPELRAPESCGDSRQVAKQRLINRGNSGQIFNNSRSTKHINILIST